MLGKKKTITATGTSTVKVQEKDAIAMTMNASITEEGTVAVNKYIQNKDVYIANKEAIDADFAEFEQYVDSLMEV